MQFLRKENILELYHRISHILYKNKVYSTGIMLNMTHATEKSYGLSLYTRLAIYEGVSAESPLDETEISYSRRNIKVKLVLWKYFHG